MNKAIKISIAVGILIVSSSVAYYFGIFLPKQTKVQDSTQNVSQESDLTEVKKQALTDFYNEISLATDTKDLEKLYEFLPQSMKAYVTKDQYISYQEKINEDEKVFSRNTTINSISVENDKGFVDSAVITCLSEACTGSDRIEDDQKKEYEYKDGKWKVPDPEPSERALTASTNGIQDVILKLSKDKRDDFLNKKSYGTGNITLATRVFALELDNDLQKLILVEHDLEKAGLSKGSTFNAGSQTPTMPTNTSQSSDSFFDEYKQKQQQQCQKDLNEYNVCMNEYNAKMGEYNTCLSENANPNNRFKSYCSKPSNFCFKPVCAY